MAPPYFTSPPKHTQFTIDHFLRSPHKARLGSDRTAISLSRSSLSKRTVPPQEIPKIIDISNDEEPSDIISVSSDEGPSDIVSVSSDDLDISSTHVPETIITFLRFNRRNSQPCEFSRHENNNSGRIGRYKLGNIASTTQVSY